MDALELSRWQFGITTVYHFMFVPLTIGLALAGRASCRPRGYRTGNDAVPAADQVLRQALPHQLRHGRGHRHRAGVPVRHELERVLALRRRRLRRPAGHGGAASRSSSSRRSSGCGSSAGTGCPRTRPPGHASGLAAIGADALGVLHPRRQLLDAAPGRRRAQPRDRPRRDDRHLGGAHQQHRPRRVSRTRSPARSSPPAASSPASSAWLADARHDADAGRSTDDAAPHRRCAPRSASTLSPRASPWSVTGDIQAKLMFEQQPMKMAAAEALCETEPAAGLLGARRRRPRRNDCDERRPRHRDPRPAVVPRRRATSTATVEGVNGACRTPSTESSFGPGDYLPNLAVTYWGFRAHDRLRRRRLRSAPWWRCGSPARADAAAPSAVAAHRRRRRDRRPRSWPTSFGWIFTEMGRQPWVVAPNPTGDRRDPPAHRGRASRPRVGGAWSSTSLIAFTAALRRRCRASRFLADRRYVAGQGAAGARRPTSRHRPTTDHDDATATPHRPVVRVLTRFAY